MLKELRIENFAIIQSLELHFGEGLIIFTGETGAGKSIILDAIEALVGGRTDATMVRSGADRAVLEAVFTIPAAFHDEAHSILKREALDEGSEEVVFGREIRLEGRTVARVNGRSVNVSLLKEMGSSLVDIHGQSEHLSLLNVRSHLGFSTGMRVCRRNLMHTSQPIMSCARYAKNSATCAKWNQRQSSAWNCSSFRHMKSRELISSRVKRRN